jgi:hypothetical protein
VTNVVEFHPSAPGLPTVTLKSGETLSVRRVMLYNANNVNEIMALRAQAQQNLGGVSTGIGFWGSPGWVIEGALVLGAIENWLSNKSAKLGMEQMTQARQKYLHMMTTGLWFDVPLVANFNLPQPALWSAITTREVKQEVLGPFLKKKTETALSRPTVRFVVDPASDHS